jgi:hypothetical protein
MPESDQRSIHAWHPHATVEHARSHGEASVRRTSTHHRSSAASVAAAPSSLLASSPSTPSDIG